MSWQAVLHLFEKADGDINKIDQAELEKAFRKIEYGRRAAGMPEVQMIVAKIEFIRKYRKESKNDGQTGFEFS